MDERLKKQMDFILEVDKVKNIMRQTYLADGKRKENDAEHSWHLALMAVLLKRVCAERSGSVQGNSHGSDPRPCGN